jgi:hypothetical protein
LILQAQALASNAGGGFHSSAANFPYKKAVLTQQQKQICWERMPAASKLSMTDDNMGCWPKLTAPISSNAAPPSNARVVTTGEQCLAAIRCLAGRPKLSVACELQGHETAQDRVQGLAVSAVSLIIIWAPALKTASQSAASVLIDMMSASEFEKQRIIGVVKSVMEDPTVVKVIISYIHSVLGPKSRLFGKPRSSYTPYS